MLLNEPQPLDVRVAPGGVPDRVGARVVAHVRESWLIEDRWWTAQPLRRRYWEVVTACGRNLVMFHDLQAGGWFGQRD